MKDVYLTSIMVVLLLSLLLMLLLLHEGTSLFASTLIHDYHYNACILHLITMLVSVLRHRVKKFCYIWCMIFLLIIKSYMSEILFTCLQMSEILSEIVRNR